MAGYNPSIGDQSTGPNMQQILDLLGQKDMGTGQDIQSFIADLMSAGPDQYGPQGPPDTAPENYNEYQDEPYQVAGDVLPMRTHPPSVSDVNMRLQSPGVGARSQGMQSIERFGGNPRTLDLLGILNMMTGREPGR